MKHFLFVFLLLSTPSTFGSGIGSIGSELGSLQDELKFDIEQGNSSQKSRVKRMATLNEEDLNELVLESVNKAENDAEKIEIKQSGWCGSKFLLEVGALTCTVVATITSAISAIKSSSDDAANVTLANNLTIVSMTFTLAGGILQFFGNQSWVSRHAKVKELNSKLKNMNSKLLGVIKKQKKKFKEAYETLDAAHAKDQLELERLHVLEQDDQRNKKTLYKDEYMQVLNQNQILKEELLKTQNMLQIWQVSTGKQNERLAEDSKNLLSDSRTLLEKLGGVPIRKSYAGGSGGSGESAESMPPASPRSYFSTKPPSPRTPLRASYRPLRPDTLVSKKATLKKTKSQRASKEVDLEESVPPRKQSLRKQVLKAEALSAEETRLGTGSAEVKKRRQRKKTFEMTGDVPTRPTKEESEKKDE